MPSHLSDSEVLEHTAEWLSRLADTIERITERMADRLATISAEQERQADEIRALSNRIEALTRAAGSERDAPTIHVPGPRLLEP
jgi:hypothetical protein